MRKLLITAGKITAFFLVWAVLGGLIEIPGKSPAIWRFWAEAVPFLVLVLFTAVFLLPEKGRVRIPILAEPGKAFAVGSLTGLCWIGISAAVLLAGRQLAITGRQAVPDLWLWILSAFINVMMQELLVRGYIYQLLKTGYGLPAAVIFTTALFTLLHGGAFAAGLLPVINVITMCLFTTAMYEAEDSLLAPVIAHALWNIIGALILGGVSLAEDYPSLYTTQAVGSPLLSGGAYRIEGSLVVTIVNILLILVFFTVKRKKEQERK